MVPDTRAKPPVVLDERVATGLCPIRNTHAHKGQNGRMLVIGGSYLYHGAPILASLAALRLGADLVYTAVPKHNVAATRAASPDLIVIPMADAKLTRGSASKMLGVAPAALDSAAIGMGLAIQERGALQRVVQKLVASDVRLVFDAAALIPEMLDVIPGTNCVLTPHAGEFEHMFGESPPPESELESRINTVSAHASKYHTVILLKGHTDVISDGENTYLCSAGTPGMTTGGTGDVLAGLIAGTLAVCRRPLDAAALGAYTNGIAGESVAARFGHHMLASDLLDEIPVVLKNLDDNMYDDNNNQSIGDVMQ